MRAIILLAVFCVMVIPDAFARNVSYEGGWTFLEEFNDDNVYGLIHHTINPRWAMGYRQEYFRGPEWNYSALQLNYLAKRWNFADAQANVYVLSNVGVAYAGGSNRTAGSLGLEADWEDRRFFISYGNRYLNAGKHDEFWLQKGRLGIAPYVAEYGRLHTWLMVEAGHSDQRQESLSVTPLVRFFKSTVMVELGSTIGGGPLVNFRLLF